jgi:hypothetical protein
MTNPPTGPDFVRGNAHLERLLSDPQLAAEVAELDAAAQQMDRDYAMNLENRSDMLLSTLLDYLTATGAEQPAIAVTVHGRRVELGLADLTNGAA